MTARIYVTCLNAYNNGHEHGDWLDVDSDSEALWEGIKRILKTSPFPGSDEWAIHDYEGFGSLQLSESESPEQIVEYIEFLEEYGEELASELLNHGCCNDVSEARRFMEDHYHGEFESEVDFIEQLTNDCYTIPTFIASYIDYEKLARDCFIDDYFSIEADGKTHVFSNC